MTYVLLLSLYLCRWSCWFFLFSASLASVLLTRESKKKKIKIIIKPMFIKSPTQVL